MAVDLTPLEQAAGRAGLPGLRARLVTPDRRRGTWFSFRDGELLVSERIVDRCRPEDASALLIDEILRVRRQRRLAVPFGVAAALGVAALGAGLLVLRPGPLVCVLLAAGAAGALAAAWSVLRLKAGLAGDDETVALLGDPTALVRGLNLMNEEELHVAGRRWAARPDLHWRAERLARIHRLCAGGAGDG